MDYFGDRERPCLVFEGIKDRAIEKSFEEYIDLGHVSAEQKVALIVGKIARSHRKLKDLNNPGLADTGGWLPS